MAQRRIYSCFDHRLTQQRFQLANQRKVRPALHQKLNDTGVLAGRSIQLFRQTLVLNHGSKDDVGQFTGLFLMQIFQFCSDIIRQNFAGISHKLGHNVGHMGYLFTFTHKCSLVRTASVNYG
ncbi:Uncharacterised protein [Salmonella enterica subsp. enterica serovar Bovismorbificans]|uniref:Uncharacterized protein n=1 Tax=Salmonella enterica subsp. enterica serovar Bovismorbificans TaxID=58097 RepID=A0A655DRJ2_SALET|nr:Uncharacterised protein [Salmonella enterica subsp. enterica serovar Bovismorbificans]